MSEQTSKRRKIEINSSSGKDEPDLPIQPSKRQKIEVNPISQTFALTEDEDSALIVQASKRQKLQVDTSTQITLIEDEDLDLTIAGLGVVLNWLNDHPTMGTSNLHLSCKALHSHSAKPPRTCKDDVTLENLAWFESLGADRYKLCKNAIKKNDTNFLEAVIGKHAITNWFKRRLKKYIFKFDNLEMFKWLIIWHRQHLDWTFSLIPEDNNSIGRYNAQRILDYLQHGHLHNYQFNKTNLIGVLEFCHLGMLKTLHAKGLLNPSVIQNSKLICHYAKTGNLKGLQYIKSKHGLAATDNLFYFAAQSDHIHIVEWLKEENLLSPNLWTQKVGPRVLRWWVDYQFATARKYATEALRHKDFELFDLIRSRDSKKSIKWRVMIMMLTSGYCDTAYLDTCSLSQKFGFVMSDESDKLTTDQIKWLSVYRPSPSEPLEQRWGSGLNVLLSRNPPGIIEWAYEQKVWSQDALWSAIGEDGTVEMADWLYATNKTDYQAIYRALLNHEKDTELRLFKWALEKRPEFAYWLYRKSLKGQHLMHAQWLQSKYKFHDIITSISDDISDITIETVDWLIQQHYEFDDTFFQMLLVHPDRVGPIQLILDRLKNHRVKIPYDTLFKRARECLTETTYRQLHDLLVWKWK